MIHRRILFPSLLVLLACTTQRAIAAEVEEIKQLLARPIIGPSVALAEVQEYTEARVPPMPAVKTLAEWEEYANRTRRETLARVVYRGEAARWRDAPCRVEWLDAIEGGPGYSIKKLRYEAVPGLWVPALLYEPEKLSEKTPVMMAVNGHDGAGKAAGYKQIRCINLAKRGMRVLNVEWFNMGQLRSEGFVHYRLNQIDLCGTSGLAPFYLSMKRGLDILLSLEKSDPERVAVSGLSGGGWQTIIISSLDTRVTLTNPVAGYSSFRTRARHFSDLGDSEQTPVDLAVVTDYAPLTAMLAPRAALLTYNVKDNCCFASGHALPPLLEAAEPIYKLYGKEGRLRSHINHDPGTHNYEQDNREALYRMIGDHFYAGSAEFDPKEIECKDEVKTKEQLAVPLPEENLDLHKLAIDLAKELPRQGELPKEKQRARAWQDQRREAVRQTVQYKQYAVMQQSAETETKGATEATFLRLRIGDSWTVPVVKLRRGESKGTTIVVADGGRQSAAEAVERLLAAGQTVVAMDPFYFGESKIAQKDFLFALLVSAIGDRPLGLQASQVAAVARWLKSEAGGKAERVTIVSQGPRSGLYALAAAALEPAIDRAELDGSYGSLKEVLEQNLTVDKTPELFCFGLLEATDIMQLVALAAPRDVVFKAPSDRAKSELAGLEAWYRLLGREHRPVGE
jgi:hypothetical protein